MPTTSDLIGQALDALTLKNGFNKPHQDQIDEADARARIATATAVDRLAAAFERSLAPAMPTPDYQPAGVIARFVTHIGLLTLNPDIAVYLGNFDEKNPHDIPTAICQGCGWQGHHGIGLRPKLLEAAQTHANGCTAIPNPRA
ncbi:MAG: hypothetical protein HOY75_08040 [Streptomyces sp.]|nr:hypothetical protein [Streptomyces sp.]